MQPDSAAYVGELDELVASEEQQHDGPWINTSSYSVPIYTVPAGQPTVAVQLEDHAPDAALSAAWSEVPLPAEATPAAGTDGDLVVWQPSTDRMWEFWRLVSREGSWYATWGGAMEHVASDSGVYEAEDWSGAQPWWGVAATSFSLLGGLITLEDLERGEINHALSMSIPHPRAGVYAAPAQRDDGNSIAPFALPEGAHLRLNPKLDIAALHLPRITRMIAEAAQRYGIIIRDKASIVTFQAQDPTNTTTNPYTTTNGYFEGRTPMQILAAFPWTQLQVLRESLRRP